MEIYYCGIYDRDKNKWISEMILIVNGDPGKLFLVFLQYITRKILAHIVQKPYVTYLIK